jgi:hypothetical protein
MTDNSRRKKLLFIGSILVAIMFISSAAAFGNFGSPPPSTTTTVTGPSYFMVGDANATVEGWSQNVQISTNRSDNASYSIVANVLASMQANGTVSNYLSVGNGTFSAYLVNVTAYALQSRLDVLLGNSIATVQSATTVMLPSQMTMYYYSQPIPVQVHSRNYTVSIEPLKPIGSIVPVTVQGTVTASGNIISQLNVIYKS